MDELWATHFGPFAIYRTFTASDMNVIASQITDNSTVFPTACSVLQQEQWKYQCSKLLSRWEGNPPLTSGIPSQRSGMRKTFPCHDVVIHVDGEIHYSDVIMSTIASLITSLTIVYSTVYSDADQRKYQSSALQAFVWGIHRGPVNSPHKWPVKRKMFPFDDVIMPGRKPKPYWTRPHIFRLIYRPLCSRVWKHIDILIYKIPVVGHVHSVLDRRPTVPRFWWI